jgi:membrane protease YdiL (CAAX protease family)
LKIFLRILFLILLSQLFGFLFYFVLNDFSINKIQNGDFQELELIKKLGVELYLFVSQLVGILFPAIIALFAFNRKNFISRIGISLKGKYLFVLYGLMFLFMAYPLIQLSAVLNEKLHIYEIMKNSNELAEQITKMVLIFKSFSDFLLKTLLVAFLPAFSEELFFRAGIQKEMTEGRMNANLAIILTALIFSAFHMQFDGFLPRFFLGLILGYVYYWSGSLTISIIIHFFNNFILLLSAYLNPELINSETEAGMPQIPIYILLISIVSVFILRAKLLELKNMELNKDKPDG